MTTGASPLWVQTLLRKWQQDIETYPEEDLRAVGARTAIQACMRELFAAAPKPTAEELAQLVRGNLATNQYEAHKALDMLESMARNAAPNNK